MDRASLQSWRSIPMAQFRRATLILVLTGLVLVTVTRLTILPGDVVVVAGEPRPDRAAARRSAGIAQAPVGAASRRLR